MKRILPITLLALLPLALALGCERTTQSSFATALTGGGDPQRGAQTIGKYGCAGCHTIPGIRGAEGLVGPPLTNLAQRSYIGGVLRNSPDNLTRWVMNAPGIDPMTAMPNLHLTQAEARDVAAYLYTLK
jgi:mono/diheme cytochrome c family protein